MAKEALTERFQKDGALRDTAERVRQKRSGESSEFFDDASGEPKKEASSAEKKTLYKDYLEGKFDLKENADGDGTLSDQSPRNSQKIQNYIEKLREESAKMQEERTKNRHPKRKSKNGRACRLKRIARTKNSSRIHSAEKTS